MMLLYIGMMLLHIGKVTAIIQLLRRQELWAQLFRYIFMSTHNISCVYVMCSHRKPKLNLKGNPSENIQ